jgi:hypothetical protein
LTGGGAHFAAKIVRGAYLEKERKLAQINNYNDPINDNYEETGKMYNKVISYLVDRASEKAEYYR